MAILASSCVSPSVLPPSLFESPLGFAMTTNTMPVHAMEEPVRARQPQKSHVWEEFPSVVRRLTKGQMR